MSWYCCKRFWCIQKPMLLLLGVVGLCGIVLIKYVFGQCVIKDIQDEADDPRRKTCRNEFYAQITLRDDYEGKLNCSGIVRGHSVAINQGIKWSKKMKINKVNFNYQTYMNITKDCKYFKEFRRYIVFPMSREEEEFPIAYSMVIHDNIEMFERLLRALYAPQNIYCVHLDEKSPEQFKKAVKSITSCFSNVFIATRLIKVVYASWSRVQADLNCMKDLLKSEVQWRYLLNTCGTDFPLKTNAEIVRALRSLNGKNSMESESPSSSKRKRWEFHYEVGDGIYKTDTKKSPPPIASPMFSGNAYFVVCRNFVKYIFVNPLVQTFINWVKDTYSPDEHLWATLNRMPGVPGSYPYNSKYEQSDMNALARMVKWEYEEGDIEKGAAYPICTGTHRRSVCIYGIGDISWLLQQHHFLGNKFDPDVDNIAIKCLEEYLRYKTVYRKEL